MPTVYLDPILGNDSRSYIEAQNPATPWQSAQEANDSSVTDDIVSMAPGVYDSGASNVNLTKQLSWEAPLGGVTWISSNANYVVRIAAGFPSGASLAMSGFTIDGQDTSANCFEIGNVDTRQNSIIFSNMVFSNATLASFDHNQRRGTAVFNDCTFSGNTPNGFITSAQFGEDLDDTSNFTFTNPVFNLTPLASSVRGISIRAQTATVPVGSSLTITNPTGVVSGPAGAFTAKGIELGGLRDVVVEDITPSFVVSGQDGQSHKVVELSGDDFPFFNGIVRNSEIVADFNAGHIVEMGMSQADNQGSTGFVQNVRITGLRPDLVTGTPHNLTAGQNTDIDITGITSIWGHIGLLSSLNSNTTIDGATFIDNDSSSIYAKGCSGGQADNCVVYNTGTYPISQFGLLSVNDQGGTPNTDFTFNSAEVYAADQTTINALATISPGDSATYNSTIYYLPNDNGVDLLTDDYFGRQADAAVDTLAEWQLDHPTDNIDASSFSQQQILNIIAGISDSETVGNIISSISATSSTSISGSIKSSIL